MYTLKSIVRRGTPMAAVIAIVAATVLPSAAVFADELNPLTERSLLLSSSAPGFVDTDGSGNSAANPNSIGENYAPAGSGPNGKKTGETFSFKVSSDSTTNPIKAFTLQYCTTAAGYCQSPGNNAGDADPNNDGSTADSTRVANATPTTGGWANNTSDFEVSNSFTQGTGAGQFQVYVDGNPASASDWTLTSVNKEDPEFDDAGDGLTGKDNFVTLKSATGQSISNGQQVKVVFNASETVFITNPGQGSFFVKMNTFNSNTTIDDTTRVDGGVTVANVMTDSIHITTKVLETMAFSVGTRNRDTVTLNCAGYPSAATTAAGCEAATGGGATHRTCDPMQNVNGNRLNLGNPNAEYSLETGKAWGVNSYWRLSSNSSGGAAVYYSGNTLANTVGDEVSDMPSETVSTPGTEQFGLGFVSAAADTLSTEFTTQYPGKTPSSAPLVTLSGQSGAGFPAGQTAAAAYDEATGTLDDGSGGPGTAKFKFLKSSLTTPELIAQENTDVISCSTAKMRYVGNIGADTPAGVYTTKINYLAAPQY
jgi:hypothetical protein